MSKAFDDLVSIMARLRAEGGCPWDREQTHVSLKPFLIEEAYEVIEAIESGQAESLCEELGDVLFQVLFHAEIAKEEQRFDIEAVLRTSSEKMTRRHPHVFLEAEAKGEGLNSAEVLARWEDIKKKEPRNQERQSALDGVPRSLPPLLRAHQIQARASRVGFDWTSPEPVFSKIEEELQELREALSEANATTPENGASTRKIENEIGDLLFSIVNFARFKKINPEDALRKTIHRFTERFQSIERQAKEKGTSIESFSLEEMNVIWEHAKAEEQIE